MALYLFHNISSPASSYLCGSDRAIPGEGERESNGVCNCSDCLGWPWLARSHVPVASLCCCRFAAAAFSFTTTIIFVYGLLFMPRGKRLSDDLRAIIVRKKEEGERTIEIAEALRIPLKTIEGILTTWNKTGTVLTQKLKNHGRPRKVETEDTQVCYGHFHLTYLTLSCFSIFAALRRTGMTYIYRRWGIV